MKTFVSLLRHVVRSASFYPFTIFYVGAVLVVMLASGSESTGRIEPITGVLLLGVLALCLLMVATLRELQTLQKLMEGQRTELLGRIDELVAMLEERGADVPPPTGTEIEARTLDQREVNSHDYR